MLTLAHYRTSPVDLRRLFDAPKQQFYKAEYQGNLLGGLWLMEEGGMVERYLIEQICRGERRPKGNLVAQSLAFYYHFPQACELRSLRISRIAVQPNWQNQGIGQQLIHSLSEKANVDFLSVSFGYTPELMRFWQKCGFILVQISEYKESSSGCYSAIAVKGISPQGKALEQQLSQQFQRDIGLSFHPFATIFQQNEINWQLNDRDWLYLKNFADYYRTLSSSLPAIRRLLAISAPTDCPLLREYCLGARQNRQHQEKFGGKKSWLIACRKEVKILLQNV